MHTWNAALRKKRTSRRRSTREARSAEQKLEAYVIRRHLRAKGAGRRGRLRCVRELRAFVRSGRDETLLELGERQIGVAANMLIGRSAAVPYRLPLNESERLEAARRSQARWPPGHHLAHGPSATAHCDRTAGRIAVLARLEQPSAARAAARATASCPPSPLHEESGEGENGPTRKIYLVTHSA